MFKMEPANEEGRLLAAPIEFKRMLSWQLSAPTDVPSSRKKKRQRKKSREAGNLDQGRDELEGEPVQESKEELTDGISTTEYAYVYVNSDGEEEMYYSAPESPLTSEDDDQLTTIPPYVDETPKRQQQEQRSKRSKRSKKNARYLARIAKVEFFQPLCDLVEDKLQLEVDRLEVSSYAQVPTLTEMCIKKIRVLDTLKIDEGVPFLIHSLLFHDKQQRATVAVHVRWLERFLAAFEKQLAGYFKRWTEVIHNDGRKNDDFLKRALHLQSVYSFPPLNELPNEGEGLHCPLPPVLDQDYLNNELRNPMINKVLLHLINYLFPLVSGKGSRGEAPVELSGSLSRSQLAAIHYVNDFVTSRYKSVSKFCSEFLKVWPGYVYWARGQLKLAANAFINSIKLLSHANDKACVLNELGRMFLTFGDRSSTCRYFRQACTTATHKDEEDGLKKSAMQISSFTLEAAAWDCGFLTPPTAREAARAWLNVLKEVPNVTISQFPWYFHTALCESRLCFHAGVPVGDSPSSPLNTVSPNRPLSREVSTLQWLDECEQLISKLTNGYPVLYYHLSVVYALQGWKEASHDAWRSFINSYYGFHDWPNWVKDNTSIHLFSSPGHHGNPWQPLLDMLTKQRLKCAPVMKIRWRVRLLQPYYPYYFCSYTKTFLADHCATPPGLRLSPDGYLTGDFHLDMPPMRCVLIDPYTGALQLSRSSALNHYNLHTFISPATYPTSGVIRQPDRFALPWPLRVFESDRCIVELQLSSTTDLEGGNLTESNYHASLHWYGQDNTQGKIDVRKMIRKELRESILQLASELGMDKNEEFLDELMSKGRSVHFDDLYNKFEPKYRVMKEREGKVKRRNYNVFDFQLMLTYRAIYGQSTLVLCFNLNPRWDYYDVNKDLYGQALVFVNCATLKSFMQPKIHCVVDDNGFQLLYPNPASCSAYQDLHLKHLSYITVVRSELSPQLSATNKKMVDHTQLVFDHHGNIVLSEKLEDTIYLQNRGGHGSSGNRRQTSKYPVCLGNRLFVCKPPDGSTDEVVVISFDLNGRCVLTSRLLKATTLHQFTGVPGLLVIHTNNGVVLLHPGTLEPISVQIEGANSTPVADETRESVKYQFDVQDARFSVLKVWNVGGCEVAQSSASQGIETDSNVGSTKEESSSSSGKTQAELVDKSSTESSSQSVVDEASSTSRVTGAVGGESDGEAASIRGDLRGEESVVGVASSSEEGRGLEFGYGDVAFTVNNRLLVIRVGPRSEHVHVLLDQVLPGLVTELHPMGRSGYMISVTKFPDHFRSEIYWLSESGQLMGVLPAVGKGPHGFFSATLESSKKSSVSSLHGAETLQSFGEEGSLDDDDSGLYVFFNDGMGGISCLRPTVPT